MRTTQQLSLFKKDLRFHGGSLLNGKRRTVRPLSSKDAIHIVLRSTWAYGENSLLLLKNKKDIQRIILRTAKKYLVRVYKQAIVSNHLHLIIKIPNRKNYQTFIRVLSSLIASHVMKMQSFKVFKKSIFKSAAGDPPNKQRQHQKALLEAQGKGQAFWQFRPFTRILNWGKDFKTACQYLVKNNLKALGFIPYTKRILKYEPRKKELREKTIKSPKKITHPL